ncbi:hypothetical protein CDL15_Pgr027452 [Punica granatum]|nr:hypothetical protein CDL15_Pgr027452 [Punica granatum]
MDGLSDNSIGDTPIEEGKSDSSLSSLSSLSLSVVSSPEHLRSDYRSNRRKPLLSGVDLINLGNVTLRLSHAFLMLQVHDLAGRLECSEFYWRLAAKNQTTDNVDQYVKTTL